MDAYDWSTGVYATAVAMAKCMTTEELSRTAILLTQLCINQQRWTAYRIRR